jgi:hypothetical protein
MHNEIATLRRIVAGLKAPLRCLGHRNQMPTERRVNAGPASDHRDCATLVRGLPAIGGKQTGTVPQGPPSFVVIAKSGLDTDQLRTFLTHPHGAMPDLALTRSEIDNLILYIQSLQ